MSVVAQNPMRRSTSGFSGLALGLGAGAGLAAVVATRGAPDNPAELGTGVGVVENVGDFAVTPGGDGVAASPGEAGELPALAAPLGDGAILGDGAPLGDGAAIVATSAVACRISGPVASAARGATASIPELGAAPLTACASGASMGAGMIAVAAPALGERSAEVVDSGERPRPRLRPMIAIAAAAATTKAIRPARGDPAFVAATSACVTPTVSRAAATG